MNRITMLVLCACLLATGCHEVGSVEPSTLNLYGHRELTIHGSGFDGIAEGDLEVYVGGRIALNVHVVSDDTILATAQGSDVPGPVDVEVRDTGIGGGSAIAADAVTYVDTPFPEFRNVVNFGPSLSAGVVNMGYDPPGQIRSIPGVIADTLGLHFPQRIVIEKGVPIMDSPNLVEKLFVGDGVRECYVPATGERYVPAPGELCDPVIQVLDGELPLVGLIQQLLPYVIPGLIQEPGLVGGLFQNDPPVNANQAIPGAQLSDYVYGTRVGFQYLQDLFMTPAAPLRNPVCLGEPVIKRIADLENPADMVIGYDWFFDSVLFSHPPLHDLMHQMLFAMLVLSNSEFYQGPGCPAGTNDGAWRVPLISADGSTRTYQPIEGLGEECRAIQCPAALAEQGFAGLADFDAEAIGDPIALADALEPKDDVVVDWIALGLIPASADTNGNGVIDIDFENPAANELTADLLADILAADDPSDNPRVVLLSNMPYPSASSSGQGGAPGGGDDQFTDRINASLAGLYDMVSEAFVLAGRANNIVMFDSWQNNNDVLAGNRPDLTHELDGDPTTQEIFYEDGVLTRYGGAFSLDHLHLSQTMNASIAFGLIEAMNEHLGTSYPLPDLEQIWAEDPYAVTQYDPTVRCLYQGVGC